MTKLPCALLAICVSTQSLLAGSITGKVSCRGIADESNAVVYAEKIPAETIRPAKNNIILDQFNLAFMPHVLPVLVGTTVSFPNSDDVRHNVFSFSSPKRFNLGIYPKGAVRQVTFDQPGEIVLLCNIHLEMAAYVLVLETPYFAATSKDGSYSIDDLSAGKYKLSAWHERCQAPMPRAIEIHGTEELPFNFELTRR